MPSAFATVNGDNDDNDDIDDNETGRVHSVPIMIGAGQTSLGWDNGTRRGVRVRTDLIYGYRRDPYNKCIIIILFACVRVFSYMSLWYDLNLKKKKNEKTKQTDRRKKWPVNFH